MFNALKTQIATLKSLPHLEIEEGRIWFYSMQTRKLKTELRLVIFILHGTVSPTSTDNHHHLSLKLLSKLRDGQR